MRVILATTVFLSLYLPAHAEDAQGCKDAALLGRYQGASIAWCRFKDFDELQFIKAPHDYGALLDRNAVKDHSGAEWLKKQGRSSEVRYDLAPGSSALEVATSYEAALKSKGFSITFSCTDQECLTGSVRDTYVLGEQLDPGNVVSTSYADHARYLLAELSRPEGNVYASVLVGDDQDRSTAFIRILEEKPMDGGKIEAPADLSATLQQQGSADVYGILFDFDKDVVKPESKPALDDIAKALSSNPTMRLKIIGHTDNQGTADYNLDLSSRRAANVSAALVGGYGIDPSRLSFEGAGLTKPIAPNDTDEGRAKNRRVELVVQ